MKTFSLSLCLILSISIAHAQKVYFKLGGGYAVPAAAQTLGVNYIEDNNSDTQNYSSKMEAVSGSLGSGVNVHLGAGIMFSKFLGVDLNFQYMSGKQYELIDRTTYSGNYTGKNETIQKVQASAIYINPSLVITTGSGSISPYGRFGVVIASPKTKHEESRYDNTDGLYTKEREFEDKKGMAVGFQGAVGVNFPISNAFDIYAEVNFLSMAYRPKQAELTKSVTNGVDDNISEMDVREKKIEYKKEVDYENTPEPDEPTQSLSISQPFSALSLQVGVRFTLGGRSTE
jgi:opacity protein-like surface antigen